MIFILDVLFVRYSILDASHNLQQIASEFFITWKIYVMIYDRKLKASEGSLITVVWQLYGIGEVFTS